jgi:hypothetical protein
MDATRSGASGSCAPAAASGSLVGATAELVFSDSLRQRCLVQRVERTFGETRRRVKVIGRLPGDRSA